MNKLDEQIREWETQGEPTEKSELVRMEKLIRALIAERNGKREQLTEVPEWFWSNLGGFAGEAYREFNGPLALRYINAYIAGPEQAADTPAPVAESLEHLREAYDAGVLNEALNLYYSSAKPMTSPAPATLTEKFAAVKSTIGGGLTYEQGQEITGEQAAETPAPAPPVDEDLVKKKWAAYFSQRAQTSLANARSQKDSGNIAAAENWDGVAAGENACAYILSSGMSPEEAMDALVYPSRITTRNADRAGPEQKIDFDVQNRLAKGIQEMQSPAPQPTAATPKTPQGRPICTCSMGHRCPIHADPAGEMEPETIDRLKDQLASDFKDSQATLNELVLCNAHYRLLAALRKRGL